MMKPNLLITRLSAIGDCMETLPLAVALKEHWPQSKLTWIVDCGVDSLLKHHPAIDQVIRIRKGFLSRPREIIGLRQQLRSLKIDISIDPQGLFKSGVIGWLSGAKHRIGFAKGQAREQAWRLYHEAVSPSSTHLVDRQLELLQPLGIFSPHVRFGWNEPRSIGLEVEKILCELNLFVQGFAIINPGASWASKRWPVDRYSTLAKKLYETTGLRSLVVWGNQDERMLAETIVSATPRATCLAPDTSLMTLSGLLKRSRMYIGSDTGPMHMAVAVGTPCVAMFGTTRAEYCGPYGSMHRPLQCRYDAGDSKYRRHTTNDAMQEIQVSDVIERCLDVASKSVAA
ncbi:MAG: glycosyltransferase family 9 protein [Pirellulaceae bacterium]|nr:glycosyltransferase family 9 protein [Pirellulaceae bacterium]